MRHDEQVNAELQARWDSLTAHIAAVDRDLATEMDAERKLTLTEKRNALDDERRSVVERMQVLSVSRDVGSEKNVAAASTMRGRRTVDNDEVMRMIYEIRSDVAIIRTQFQDHLARCNLVDSAGFSPHVLTFLAVGGVVTLLLLAFIVVRIGMAG